MLKEKLIAAKERWAEKQKSAGVHSRGEASPDRLPPGQHVTKTLPVLDLGIHPEIPLTEWNLTVAGQVENPLTLDWKSLNALPQVKDISDFHCVTTWSQYDCHWSGVAMTTLIEAAKPNPEARFVYLTCFDGYTTNVPLEACLDDDVLIATGLNGEPLPVKHGGPARIVIPKLYAWKSAKFVRAIHFLEKDRLGFWEVRGYSNSADPFKEERFS